MHTIIFSGKIYKLFKKDPLMSYNRIGGKWIDPNILWW